MLNHEVCVLNKFGLHARPAQVLVKTASQFKAEIQILKDDAEVNAKSILGVMMLAAGPGTTLMIVADGEDEGDAVAALAKLFIEKFGEE